MKQIFSISIILGLAFLFTSAITIMEAPQDPPMKKTKKHLKLVKEENGKKTELDTIIEGDQIFVWNGDTIGGSKELKWITKDEFELDSLHQNFDFDFDFNMEKGEDGHVMIIKRKKGEKDGNVMIWHDGESKHDFLINSPGVMPIPKPPHAPGAVFITKGKKGNVIDLSDAGIISYKKKKLSGNREKITIIRNEVDDENITINEEIIIDGKENHSMIVAPKVAKKITVKKGENGEIEVIESDDVWTIKKGEEQVKVIKEDGKTIHIKEIKEGDGKKIEVKVEVEKENTEQENN